MKAHRHLPLAAKAALLICALAVAFHGATKNGGGKLVDAPVAKRSGCPSAKREPCEARSQEAARVALNAPLSRPQGDEASSLVAATAPTFADRKIHQWNTCGAWKYDDATIDFADGFVFPWGTNRLSRVNVVSQGRLQPSRRETNAIANVGVALSMVPGVSHFACEHTPSNTYRFAWSDAAVGRVALNAPQYETMNASIELFRNGDSVVTTNGVARRVARVLPFAHDGFGQDADWVRANFANAEEILSAGYPQWVEAQIGEGLTNGLFRMTATFHDDPPEIVRLFAGAYSVAVTNAGVYAFVLEKGVEYAYGTEPYIEDVSYSFSDDVPSSAPSRARRRAVGAAVDGDGGSAGVWSEDGGLENYPPSESGAGLVVWMPMFRGCPDVVHLGPGDFPRPFLAVLTDCRGDAAGVHYEWTTSDGNISIASPNAAETMVDVGAVPNWSDFDLSASATIAGRVLVSTLTRATYGEHDRPMAWCHASAPRNLIVRSEWMEGSESATASVGLVSDVATNGTLRVAIESGADKVATPGFALPAQFEISGEKEFSREFALDGIAASGAADDVRLVCVFTDASGNSVTSATAVTVLDPIRVEIPNAPETGVCVVKGASVPVFLRMANDVESSAMVEWLTAQRRSAKNYFPWQERVVGPSVSPMPMPDAGCFALKARLVCGCQSNETAYVHLVREPECEAIGERLGPCRAGNRNHIGVARTQGMLRLRNTAMAHLGLAEYGENMYLPAMNGYSAVRDGAWKCNRFVADIAIEAGFYVPVNTPMIAIWNHYPPVANDWANGVLIDGWLHLGNVPPEPGFVAALAATDGSGHCAIVDYDGWTIGARPTGIGRDSILMLDETVRYNIPGKEYNESL